MMMLRQFLLLASLTYIVNSVTIREATVELGDELIRMQNMVDSMSKSMKDLSRQVMVQQFAHEDSVRSHGDSGIRQVRGGNKGPQNYYQATHIGGSSFTSIHDHSNHERTMGMGEVSVVMNGIEFRTRHNDYKLVMASTNSTDYHATEPLPFPDVPKAVTDHGDDIDAQILEMREWFKAFREQNITHRDYRKHFKAALCYMEGTWTLDQDLEEPFESDRHHLDAESWYQLMDNIRFTSYTGTKSRLENFAYLPTKIMSVDKDTGIANIAQWNYRILCHPIDRHIPTKYLKQVDDMSFRFPRGRTQEQVSYSRAARYKLYEEDEPKFTKYSLIDEIFAKIPGKDNVPGNLREPSFGDSMLKYDETDKALNAGYYHRWFKFNKKGAMGLTGVARGFNQENLWVAMNTQNRVAPMSLEVCKRKNCQSYKVRMSYAIPLEIVYLTPLLKWNPYKLFQHPNKGIATSDARTGTSARPLNGTDYLNHYITPPHFYQGSLANSDPADTGKIALNVLDQDGTVRQTVASGTRIILQTIEGVGKVRLRYPISPVHGEGSSVWKELNAVRDYVLKNGVGSGNEGSGGDNDDDDDDDDNLPEIIDFEMSTAWKPKEHTHELSLTKNEYIQLKKRFDLSLRKTTTTAMNHQHELVIRYNRRTKSFEYTKCGEQSKCWDKHGRLLREVRLSAL